MWGFQPTCFLQIYFLLYLTGIDEKWQNCGDWLHLSLISEFIFAKFEGKGKSKRGIWGRFFVRGGSSVGDWGMSLYRPGRLSLNDATATHWTVLYNLIFEKDTVFWTKKAFNQGLPWNVKNPNPADQNPENKSKFRGYESLNYQNSENTLTPNPNTSGGGYKTRKFSDPKNLKP